jgi:hypothetical protein
MKTKAEYHIFHETSTARSWKWITVESLWKTSVDAPEVRVRLA